MAAKRMRKRPRSRRPWYVIAIALVLAFLGWYAGGDFRLEDLIAQGLPDSSAQQAAAPRLKRICASQYSIGISSKPPGGITCAPPTLLTST